MTLRRRTRPRDRRADRAPRVGLFGILGSGNIGNDGSLDAVIAFLRHRRPDAELGFLCMGPDRVRQRYGGPATHLQWCDTRDPGASRSRAILHKVVGKVVDPFRTLAWVRHYDLVIVPGMGVLEATLPLRPWGFPCSLLWLCASGRLTRTRVALVSVGANIIHQRATRWVVTRAARLAHYRSYRDELSRDAMRRMGVDVSADHVYPDLAFALPAPPASREASGAVGVGVMAYYGGNDDRDRADEIHRAYVEVVKRFVRRLVDDGRPVRLLTGDEADETVVAEILDDLREHRPGLDPSRVTAEPTRDLHTLIRRMAEVDTVVATRYHNVLCAVKLSKPTLSLGYARKNDVLMASMGLGDFCASARSVDYERLVEKFRRLEDRRDALVPTLRRRNQDNAGRLEEQFTALSALVPTHETLRVPNTRPAA